MRKIIQKDEVGMDSTDLNSGFIVNVENFKRRRALQSFWSLDMHSKMFFERALHVKRDNEFIFITKAQSRHR